MDQFLILDGKKYLTVRSLYKGFISRKKVRLLNKMLEALN